MLIIQVVDVCECYDDDVDVIRQCYTTMGYELRVYETECSFFSAGALFSFIILKRNIFGIFPLRTFFRDFMCNTVIFIETDSVLWPYIEHGNTVINTPMKEKIRPKTKKILTDVVF